MDEPIAELHLGTVVTDDQKELAFRRIENKINEMIRAINLHSTALFEGEEEE